MVSEAELAGAAAKIENIRRRNREAWRGAVYKMGGKHARKWQPRCLVQDRGGLRWCDAARPAAT